MNPIILTALIIPASVAFGLITLLIKERDHFFPKKTTTGQRADTTTQADQQNYENKVRERTGFIDTVRRSTDFLDLSGGSMGI